MHGLRCERNVYTLVNFHHVFTFLTCYILMSTFDSYAGLCILYTFVDYPAITKWIVQNVLSLDTERVVIQRGEEPLRKMLVDHGMKPIEVDMRSVYGLGGGFHCWTLDIRRRGKLQSYF